MQKIKAIFKNAWPYHKDKMNLPVKDLAASIPFYETIMGFKVESRKELPYKLAVLDRDGIRIGLGENGGDPAQDGCFFEVDNVIAALEELKSAGLQKEISAIKAEHHGETSWNLFYVVAPDGLCYCIGER
jgi:catechol 2,3-dioxygenase-like lactoylglutathione lyase family enzyme